MRVTLLAASMAALMLSAACTEPVAVETQAEPQVTQAAPKPPGMTYAEVVQSLAAEKESLAAMNAEQDEILGKYGHNESLRKTVIEANTMRRVAAEKRIRDLEAKLISMQVE